ncbi:hypothetical protein D2T33_19145 [Sinirhodobacter populi]|uniref:Uncharacterized protein n=1 Tax=Paenirhodobacter populi TaxID=2306993 RepID=A0A443ILS5_9RHOB|nr:hypothetical protein D2T33_19145 [Sinirhodobacter populi]
MGAISKMGNRFLRWLLYLGAMDVIASRMHHADVVMEVGDTFFEAQCTAAKLRLLCIRTIFEASARALGFFRCESRQHDCGNR